MSCTFQMKDPKDGTIVVDTDTPLLTSCTLIKMVRPFDKTLGAPEPINQHLRAETPGSPQFRLIQGLQDISGLWSADIHAYRLVMRFGPVFPMNEMTTLLLQLVVSCWPNAQFLGSGWSTQAIGRTGTLLEVPDFEISYAKFMRTMALKPEAIAILGNNPESKDPLWLMSFRPTEVFVRDNGWHTKIPGRTHIFTSRSMVWLTDDPDMLTYVEYDPSNARPLHRTQLEVNFGAKCANLFRLRDD